MFFMPLHFVLWNHPISQPLLHRKAQNRGMMGPFVPRPRMRLRSYDLWITAIGQCLLRSALAALLWMQLSHMDAEEEGVEHGHQEFRQLYSLRRHYNCL